MKFRLLMVSALVLLGRTRAALAHEFWGEAQEYQVDTGGVVEAGIFNGQNFEGPELAWFERRVARTEARIAGAVLGIGRRSGIARRCG